MADKAHRFADDVIDEIEKRLRKEYSRAQREMQAKWDAYMRNAQAKVDALYTAYVSAPPDKKAAALARYQQAARNMTLNNRWYKEMVADLTSQLAHTNEAALAYVNGQLPGVYREAFNAVDKRIAQMGIDYSLVDQSTVRRMIMDGDIKLPKKTLNIPKDMRWNTKQINSDVLQGILQGESMQDIARRVFPEIMKKTALTGLTDEQLAKVVRKNWIAAMRNTRTMVTGAENRGRQDRYEDLESRGVVMTKVWLATADGRTRDWHMSMDGQEVDVKDMFVDGLGNELEYPGDPGAEPETVYNCFPGDMLVLSDSEIQKSYKRYYDGNLITIRTSRGVNFTCTPNHPILSDRGWIAADCLNEGDNLLITKGSYCVNFRRNPNINHVATTFDATHKALSVSATEGAVNMPVNFHGAGIATDVEIVTKKSLLRCNGNTCSSKSVNKFLFKFSDIPFTCKRSFLQHLRRVWLAAFSYIRCKCKSFSLLLRSLRHSVIHGFGAITNGNIVLTQTQLDNFTTDSEFFCKSLDGLTGNVFADKIIGIEIKSFHGYVYNLQTENNYYLVNSISQESEKCNGFYAISHNCRCAMRTNILGFRDSAGRMQPMSFSNTRIGNGTSLHERQIEAERQRRK